MYYPILSRKESHKGKYLDQVYTMVNFRFEHQIFICIISVPTSIAFTRRIPTGFQEEFYDVATEIASLATILRNIC